MVKWCVYFFMVVAVLPPFELDAVAAGETLGPGALGAVSVGGQAERNMSGDVESWSAAGSLPGVAVIPEADGEEPLQPLRGRPLDGLGRNLYDPSGRRDPFNSLVTRDGNGARPDVTLPPLQQVGLTELSLIGIIWGGFGYTAMVQTPDGKGYAVRRGTRMGANSGIVTSITENGFVVTEKVTDVYGRQQEREYVKHLHTQEELE